MPNEDTQKQQQKLTNHRNERAVTITDLTNIKRILHKHHKNPRLSNLMLYVKWTDFFKHTN